MLWGLLINHFLQLTGGGEYKEVRARVAGNITGYISLRACAIFSGKNKPFLHSIVPFSLLFFLQVFNQFQGHCHQLVRALINSAFSRADNKAGLACAAVYSDFGVGLASQMSCKLFASLKILSWKRELRAVPCCAGNIASSQFGSWWSI